MRFVFGFIFSLFYYKEKKLSFYASSLALYLILSLFPSLMIILIIINTLFLKTKYYPMLLNELQKLMNFNIVEMLGLSVSHFGRIAIGYGSFSFIIVILFATIFIRGFFDTINYIFEIDTTKTKKKWLISFGSIFMVVIILILLLIIKIVSAIIFKWASEYINIAPIQQYYFNTVYYLVLWLSFSFLLYSILKGEVSLKKILFTSALILIVISLFSKIYFIMANKTVYNILYGSFSAIILSIMYMWMVFNIFFLILVNLHIQNNFKEACEKYLSGEYKSIYFFFIKKLFDIFNLNRYYRSKKDRLYHFYELTYQNKSFNKNKGSKKGYYFGHK